MSASIIQINELPIISEQFENAKIAWFGIISKSSSSVALFASNDKETLLEIRAHDGWSNLEESVDATKHLWDVLAPYAAGDFRREILTLVEEPKPTNIPLPESAHLELRYVEVLPRKYQAYLKWREKTIFDVVRESPQITTFSAYHTVFSTRPGVLFLSGFDCEIDEYTKVFTSDRYRKIVQAAGDNYITGGNQGLATRIYTRVKED
ncbi:hypothetical protein [Corynebacterium freiburgense]|uniref:hypothetical protein n=1 Tax=Corynebacterium freiburgense TaxID=556548 RepID=UPI00041B2EE4|nr:hypothetical protein [Corynebacterium freiburgense]WJZ02945.1 hypothetical protein CFREI_08335 [Corynebacterium freiburgense]